MSSIERTDLLNLVNSKEIKWSDFENSSFLITGGTGLIGSMLTKLLLMRNNEKKV